MFLQELIMYPTYSDNMTMRMFGTIEPTSRKTAIFSRFSRPLHELDDMCRNGLDRFHALYFALDARSAEPLDHISDHENWILMHATFLEVLFVGCSSRKLN